MLTVTHGRRTTRVHILVYTLLLAPIAIGAAFTSIGGPIYLAVAVILNAAFLKGAFDIWRRDEVSAEADGYRTEKKVFALSLFYLFGHFTAILVQSMLAPYGIGSW